MVKYVPSKGDIVWLDFDPQKGAEINKTRPAIVISPINYNQKTSLALFLPITSKTKQYPFEVIVDTDKIKGVVLCDQIRSLDWEARNVQFITKADVSTMQVILQKLGLLIF